MRFVRLYFEVISFVFLTWESWEEGLNRLEGSLIKGEVPREFDVIKKSKNFCLSTETTINNCTVLL